MAPSAAGGSGRGESLTQDLSTLHLCVLFARLGPYHHARLRAAGQRGRVSAIELARVDNEYAWDEVPGADSFRRHTLFSDSGSLPKTVTEIRRRMFATLDRLQPDVVAIPGWSFPDALAALSWSVNASRPTVVMSESQAHDHPRIGWKESVKGRIVRINAAGLAGGRSHVDYLCKLGMHRDQIFTGYDVVDNTHFQKGAEEARGNESEFRSRLKLPQRYFLASNRFIEKKNLPGLIRAFAAYHAGAGADAWDLVLLGHGPLRASLERQCREFGLHNHVFFPGFQQYGLLPSYYGLAGAFLHASTTEPWGLVVNEAMAAGLPVVVSERCGCAPDLVANGRNGFTFDPCNTGQLTELMGFIATNQSERSDMGQASQEIIAKWTPEAFADGIWNAAKRAAIVSPRGTSLLDQALLWSTRGRV